MELPDLIERIGLKPYHQEPAGVIYCGDCLDIMPKIPDGTVDLVLTDPPYGTVDGRGKVWHGDKKFNPGDWDRSLPVEWIPEAIRALDIGHWWFVFTDSLSVKIVWDAFETDGGKGKEVFAWIKPTYAPQPRRNFCSAFELAVCGTHGPAKSWNGGGHSPNYISSAGVSFDKQNTNHPTQKPIRVISWLLERLSFEGDLILDPFLGSGTTAVAAKQLGRKFIGIEISEEYCKIAKQRLSQEELF